MLSLPLIKKLIDDKLQDISHYYTKKSESSILAQAMDYSLLSDGKRIRGILTVCTANIFDVNTDHSLIVAAAIEIIHTYSLIHDDLPSMDNSDTRRNKPSSHKKFDEATAILAGDALLTLAFEIITGDLLNIDYKKKCDIVHIISTSAGYQGMVGGQMLDILQKTHHDKEKIKQIRTMKTAKLFIASCVSGLLLGNANQSEIEALIKYAQNIGIIFQIIDDIKDRESKNDFEEICSIKQLIKDTYNAIEIFNNKQHQLIEILNTIKSTLLVDFI